MKTQRIHSAVRYASRTTGVDWEKWLTWGVIGGGAYLLYQLFTTVRSGAQALNDAGTAIGSGLYDFFHRDPLGETLYYTVTFPDGSRHSVPSRSVDNAGLFRNSGNGVNYAGDGETYRLVIEKSTGKYFAVPT